MPVTFHIPGTLREFTDGRNTIEIEQSPATLADALSALWKLYPRVRDRMATEQGQIREHVNLFIGDENVRYTGGLASPIAAGSEIWIIPAISGGWGVTSGPGRERPAKFGIVDSREKESLFVFRLTGTVVREFRRTMLKGHELAEFREQLLGWFRQFRRDLPWRRTRDPYRIWLSEIMLQQTRVAVVIPYYERFVERFPNVQSLATAPENEVLRLWSGLGYYGRARNLQKAAQQVVVRHGGNFPANLEELLALPGIGNYTAPAVLSIAFGEKLAVLDGNVARVLARIGTIGGYLRESQRWQGLQEMANSLLDPESPGDWNQAMMELGATRCTPKSPQCLICPVAQFCEGCKLGIAGSLPEKRKKHATVEIHLAAAVFADENGWTLLLPPPEDQNNESLADYVPATVSRLWHFPTVPVSGDSVAKLRSVLGELVAKKQNGNLRLFAAGKIRHTVTYRAITVQPYRINTKKLPRIKGAERVPLQEVTVLPVSNLTRKIARAALEAVSSVSQKRRELSFR